MYQKLEEIVETFTTNPPLMDNVGRIIDYARISITNHCNLRCCYCMPDGAQPDNTALLKTEEILFICKSLSEVGISKFKITGGEPLLHSNVIELIKSLKQLSLVDQVTLTTNGVLLSDKLSGLMNAGLDGVNVSLDTLRPERYQKITGVAALHLVKQGIDDCLKQKMPLKLNCVLISQFNEDELLDFAELARQHVLDIRWIEMMPIGQGKRFETISNLQILKRLEQQYGTFKRSEKKGNGPAVYYEHPDFMGKIGLISPVSQCFCNTCNRVRVTADGILKLCLNYELGFDLKELLKKGISQLELSEEIKRMIYQKPKRHAFGMTATKLETRNMWQIGG